MDRKEVLRIIDEMVLEGFLPWRMCPTCKEVTQMVLVQRKDPTDREMPDFMEGTRGTMRKSFRCMKCLGVFEETLVPVKTEEREEKG